MNDQPVKVLYILGTGHCGSTLLDMMLNAHPRITGLGEVENLRRYIPHGEKDLPPRAPGDWIEVRTNVLRHPKWRTVRRCMDRAWREGWEGLVPYARHPRFQDVLRWSDRAIQEWMYPWFLLFSCALEAFGTPVLTDASKSPHRLWMMWRSGYWDLYVVHLVRDGRGVLYSYYRKYRRFHQAMIRWVLPSIEALFLERWLPRDRWLRIHYEDLVRNPEGTLQRIVDFVGESYEDSMLRFWEVPYLGVGGNRIRENPPRELHVDERWHSGLPRSHRMLFGLTGGWLNLMLGYGWRGKR